MDETRTVLLKADHSAERVPMEVPARVGNVRVGELLGEGGGGAVFLGYDDALNRKVAVKLLHRERDRVTSTGDLIAGVRAAAGVRHANIVMVHTVEMFQDMPVIVMEYVDGLSLKQLMEQIGRFSLPMAMYVMRGVVAAVSAMHTENVIHRDLKPANILFARNGEAHVCDFGLACAFDVERYRGAAENIGGSPLYMAPEMFDGHVSPQSDVYALGVMLYELLLARPPFQGETIMETRQQHQHAPIPLEALDAEHAPQPLREAIARCLNKRLFLRYKRAENLLRALETIPVTPVELEGARQAIIEAIHRHDNRPPPPPNTGEGSDASNTFELVRRRAQQKRDQRDSH